MTGSEKKIVIVGAGPGGICAGIELLKAGYNNITILEKAPEAGGTWWYNTYPGCCCDLQSHLYSFSFEPNPDWSMPCSPQSEILRYFQHCVRRYGLEPYIRYEVEVASACWSDTSNKWTLTTRIGENIEADIFISGIGMFNELSWPDIPGINSFNGTTFHSANWQHDHDLQNRRVGVIGSAASAVQLIPVIAEKVAQLDVYQRTPNWVMPTEDMPYNEETLAHFKNDPVALRHKRLAIWNHVCKLSAPDREFAAKAEKAGLENLMSVKDPTTRDKLTPKYPFGSKRALQSNSFYPTFNRENVELVTDGIDHIAPTGIVTKDGKRRDVDTIIFATGFKATKFLSVIDVKGLNGKSLRDEWRDGAQAYLGITVSGFPNLFMLYGPNTNNGSILYMIECQVAYILRHINRMRDEGITSLNVLQAAQDAYNKQLQKDLGRFTMWTQETNGYYFSESGRLVTQCPYVMSEYREITTAPDNHAYAQIYHDPVNA